VWEQRLRAFLRGDVVVPPPSPSVKPPPTSAPTDTPVALAPAPAGESSSAPAPTPPTKRRPAMGTWSRVRVRRVSKAEMSSTCDDAQPSTTVDAVRIELAPEESVMSREEGEEATEEEEHHHYLLRRVLSHISQGDLSSAHPETREQAVRETKKLAGVVGARSWNETRERHSIVSLLHPTEVPAHDDENPLHLRDDQVCMIFWNVLMCDLFMNFLTSGNATRDPETGAIIPTVIMVTVLLTAFACLFIAWGCRIGFRFANYWCVAERRAKHPRRSVAGRCTGWLFNLLVWAVGMWTCVAQGRCLGREDTDAVLLGWMFALAFSWLIAEPILVLLFALVPLMNPPRKQLAFCAVVVEWLHLIGLDPSVFF